jgi:hypothetical protein
MRVIIKYQQDFNKIFRLASLKSKHSEGMRYSSEKLNFAKKKHCFDLKVALFAEKEQNKFAYEFKWNKFVFNNDIYV